MDGPGKTVHFQICRYISCVLPISNKLARLEVALQLKHIQYRAKTEGSQLPAKYLETRHILEHMLINTQIKSMKKFSSQMTLSCKKISLTSFTYFSEACITYDVKKKGSFLVLEVIFYFFWLYFFINYFNKP